jgi:hypothetical protein
MTDAPSEFEGAITIEWRRAGPDGPQIMPGWHFLIRDVASGQMIPTITHLTFHAPADGAVWAELTMFRDADGRPVIAADEDLASRWVVTEDGVETAVFPFRVAGMSVTG